MKIVGVIGSDGEIPEEVSKIAEKIGSEIAKKGYALLCGGRGGVMEAACRGAKSKNGLTIGVLPSLDKSQANKYVDLVMPTSFDKARNTLVASIPDVLIAVYGSVGTLSEIALRLNYRKPVVIVEAGGISENVKKLEFDERYTDLIHYAKPEQAVDKAIELL